MQVFLEHPLCVTYTCPEGKIQMSFPALPALTGWYRQMTIGLKRLKELAVGVAGCMMAPKETQLLISGSHECYLTWQSGHGRCD